MTALTTAIAGLLIASGVMHAQIDVVVLWPDGVPGSEGWTRKEATYPMGNGGLKGVRNVVKPSLTVYLPPADTASGAAVAIAPGGAFRFLSWDSEGTMVAEWLQKHGVAAFVLKYRLTDTGTDQEFAQSQGRGGGGGRGGLPSQVMTMAAADGRRAIEVIRQHATEWHIDPAKIGIMGFSAGGYVAVQAALDHTAPDRPDFVGAIYACCENPATLKVPDDAPPTFFLHAYNDPVSASSPALFQAWKSANRPAELHTYAAGGHGFGMPKHDQPTDGWIERFGDWLRYQKLMR